MFDSVEKLEEKVCLLHELISAAQYIVVHTGAGISTAAGKLSNHLCSTCYFSLHCTGIPDFRGPKGVWTLEKKGVKVETSIQFEDAQPTLTHRAITALAAAGIVKQVGTT